MADWFTGLRGFAFFSAIIIAAWIGYFWLPLWLFPLRDEYGVLQRPGPGVGGDMFGGLTALFSGLAFAGLISTLLMQRKELELQRAELALTRSEFQRQRFENGLFAVIRLFNDHVASFSAEINKMNYRGRMVLENLAGCCKDQHFNAGYSGGNESREQPLDQQLLAFDGLYRNFEGELGPYFRLLYMALRHIDRAVLDVEPEHEAMEKQTYSKMVRAYLSSEEVKLLMLFCQTERGRELKDLVERYQLLKFADAETTERNPDLVAAYSAQAFGSDEAQTAGSAKAVPEA